MESRGRDDKRPRRTQVQTRRGEEMKIMFWVDIDNKRYCRHETWEMRPNLDDRIRFNGNVFKVNEIVLNDGYAAEVNLLDRSYESTRYEKDFNTTGWKEL